MTRAELAAKYFDGCPGYDRGNMGIIALLSDVQHGTPDSNDILNDIKAILIADHKQKDEQKDALKWALYHFETMGYKPGEGDMIDTLKQLTKDGA